MKNDLYEFKKQNLLTLRTKLIMLRHSKLFSTITTLVIIIYSISLGLKSHIENPFVLSLFASFDLSITLYFIFEISLKLFAEKNKMNFFKDRWNVFDFIIILISIIPLGSLESIAIARLLRIFRILRLISVNDSLKKLLTALEGAIPSILNIVLLMFIIFYIYAVLGNQFFGDLQSGLWKNFSISMLTLFRIFTFEDWTDVMYEAMEVYPLSWTFFISFIIINAFIVFNLFIAVIIDEISKIKDNDIQYALDHENYEMITIIQELSDIKNELIQIKQEAKSNV